MVNILGLNFGHDGAVALLKEGRLVCAISRERISRRKKDDRISKSVIDYVLEASNLKLQDIDIIAFASYFYEPEGYVKLFDQEGNEIQQNLLSLYGEVTYQEYTAQIEDESMYAVHVHHHMAHCASAFFTSSFDVGACFSMDSSMYYPDLCSLFAYGEGNHLSYLYCPGLMIGNAYYYFTEWLGLGWGLAKAGTTMGLAPFGKPSAIAQENWENYGQPYYARLVQPNDDIFFRNMWGDISGLPPHKTLTKEESDSSKAMDIAASLQYVFEETIVKAADELYNKTSHYNGGNLCLSGGSFLNAIANMSVKKRTRFEQIHLFPACGDDGTAVGAALYVYHHILDRPREFYQPKEIIYLGRSYSIAYRGEPYNKNKIAKDLSEGKIVAWFQGGSEFGPRALGNRSLLADPTNSTMKDKLNFEIKHREWFRPFAPVVISEKAKDWFEIDFDSKFMLFICNIKHPEKLPAISHVDNTARVQTLCKRDNPRYYELVEAFEKITGIPILLNTSLNGSGEPIVETPEDAICLFKKIDVDILVLEDQVFRKGVHFVSE
jgi:carbamoyltransferase